MKPRITALFHTSATVGAFMASPAARNFGGNLLVECSTRPALSFALNLEIPSSYPGIAGILSGTDVAVLARPAPHLPAPIILAAGTEVPSRLIRAGLMRLLQSEERVDTITLLVPVGEARAIGAALGACERYAIAWDIAEFPHEEIISFAEWALKEQVFNAGNFAGMYPYSLDAVTPEHRRRMSEVLAPLAAPGKTAGIEIIRASS